MENCIRWLLYITHVYVSVLQRIEKNISVVNMATSVVRKLVWSAKMFLVNLIFKKKTVSLVFFPVHKTYYQFATLGFPVVSANNAHWKGGDQIPPSDQLDSSSMVKGNMYHTYWYISILYSSLS